MSLGTRPSRCPSSGSQDSGGKKYERFVHGRFKIVSLDSDKIFAHHDVALQCNKV